MNRISVAALAALIYFQGAAIAFATDAFIYSGLLDYSNIYVAPVTARLQRCGVHVTVTNHALASSTVPTARRAKGPVFIIGHSMGGVAAVEVARELAPRKVTIITLDPSRWVGRVPPNARAYNFWQQVGLGGGNSFGAKDAMISGSNHVGLPATVASRVAAIVCGGAPSKPKPGGHHHADTLRRSS